MFLFVLPLTGSAQLIDVSFHLQEMWAKNPYYWPEHAGASVAASCPSCPGTKIIFSLVLRHGNGRLLVVMGLTTTMRPFFLTCIDWINSCDL